MLNELGFNESGFIVVTLTTGVNPADISILFFIKMPAFIGTAVPKPKPSFVNEPFVRIPLAIKALNWLFE